MARFSDSAVAAALAMRRAMKEYPFPGAEDGTTCAVHALSDAELDQLRLDAVAFAKEKKADLQWDPEFLDRVVNRHVVLWAFMDPENGKRFFRDIDEVGQIDNVLLRTLIELYRAHIQALDPLAHASEEEVNALVAQMGKSETALARLSLYDRPSLLSYALSMAHLLRDRSPTPKSDTGPSVEASGSV
jgi:hypothetical protein